jgi:hypothetical protein
MTSFLKILKICESVLCNRFAILVTTLQPGPAFVLGFAALTRAQVKSAAGKLAHLLRANQPSQ